jgi:hypothetical protein
VSSFLKEMSCLKDVYIFIYIVILLLLVFLKTVAIFSAAYTLQQLGRSLQKNEKLVTVCLAQPQFLPRRNMEHIICASPF